MGAARDGVRGGACRVAGRCSCAYDAVLRNLEVLGEAAKKIPETVRVRYPEVDWRGIAGLRDLLAHACFAIEKATLWKIVRTDVPALLPHLERMEREHPVK